MAIPDRVTFATQPDGTTLSYSDVRHRDSSGRITALKNRLDYCLIGQTDRVAKVVSPFPLATMTCIAIESLGQIMYEEKKGAKSKERDCFVSVAKSLDPKWSRQLTKEFKSSLKRNWPDSEVKDLSKEVSSIADLLYVFFRNTMIHGYRSRAVYLTEDEADSWKQEEGYLILNPYWFWEAFKKEYVSLFEEVEKGQESNPKRRSCTEYIDKMLK